MMVKNIAIVGGGTAGLIAALYLRQNYPVLDITLVESDKIGIVGVGEGSTEHWKEFTIDCDIKMKELIEETDATFKYGINFDNWNGDGTNYIHTVSSAFSTESQTGSKIILAYLIANGATPKDIIHDYVEPSRHVEPFWGINQFHFNTFKLNEFLHKKCEERNIKIKKAEVESVELDDNGAISALVTSEGEKLCYDFYVDSTGFHRLLLHKTLGVAWKSYSEYLPVNSAIAFPTERTEEIPSWTLSKAMNAGWLWRIPTQDRYGNGYVFSDKHITFEEAKAEVEELYGHPIDVAKHIKFDAGRLEKFWHKNCAAIGLSGSFIEPLEASSIGSSILQSRFLVSAIGSYVPETTFAEKMFNEESISIIENIVDFVALHYVTKRNDTPFWKDVQNLPKPPGLEELLEIFKHKLPGSGDFKNRFAMFKASNWILVMHGLGLIDTKVAQAELDIQNPVVLDSIPYNATFDPIDTFGGPVKTKSHREALEWFKTVQELD